MGTKADKATLKEGLRAWRQRLAVAPAASAAAVGGKAGQPRLATEVGSEAASPTEASALFHSAVRGTQPLTDCNRVVLPKPPSRRVVAGRETAQPNSPPPAVGFSDAGLPANWRDDTRARRLPDDPEQAAFILAMAGVEPLPDSNLASLDKPPPRPAPQQTQADRQAVLHESLHAPITLQDRLEGGDEAAYLRPGLAQTVLRDLRRGRWVVQDEIDLHGLNREQARHLIAGFLHTCLHQGKRCLRIVHGKGHGSPHKLSVLRQLVRGWLAQRHEVLAYCQAKPQDGGEGALLVLLRAPKS